MRFRDAYISYLFVALPVDGLLWLADVPGLIFWTWTVAALVFWFAVVSPQLDHTGRRRP